MSDAAAQWSELRRRRLAGGVEFEAIPNGRLTCSLMSNWVAKGLDCLVCRS